jgi:5'-deoxynucleotidase YfbR-like HD superfamily hydrolase
VAQHSVLVSTLVPQHYALEGLLHDAHEAFIGDVSTPLKMLLPDYHGVEKAVEKAVRERFGVPWALPWAVKHADLVALATERRDFMAWNPDDTWDCLTGIEPAEEPLVPWGPETARREFLARYSYLTKGS